jgi:hypothetical protein
MAAQKCCRASCSHIYTDLSPKKREREKEKERKRKREREREKQVQPRCGSGKGRRESVGKRMEIRYHRD